MVKRHALHALVALVASTAPTGCVSTVGAVTGRMIANSLNSSPNASPTEAPRHSVVGWTIAGLGLGLLLDSLMIYNLATEPIVRG